MRSPDQRFTAFYRAYPVSYVGKSHLESGDKVLLPQSALDRLAGMQIQYPMLFENLNERQGRRSHCGVLEFSADEGIVYMPQWMMRNLLLEEGDVVKFTNVSLPKGRFVKLQPHKTEFIDLENPRAVLESAMRGYSCLTAGDTIAVMHGGKEYPIDILEVRPDGAASVIETDIEVDFAPPLDYEDSLLQRKAAAAGAASISSPGPPPPNLSRAGGDTVVAGMEGAAEGGGFKAFTGVGRRMDGKVDTAGPADHRLPSSAPPQTGNKILFGTRTSPEENRAHADADNGQGGPEKPSNSVQPFSGKAHSLQ